MRELLRYTEAASIDYVAQPRTQCSNIIVAFRPSSRLEPGATGCRINRCGAAIVLVVSRGCPSGIFGFPICWKRRFQSRIRFRSGLPDSNYGVAGGKITHFCGRRATSSEPRDLFHQPSVAIASPRSGASRRRNTPGAPTKSRHHESDRSRGYCEKIANLQLALALSGNG